MHAITTTARTLCMTIAFTLLAHSQTPTFTVTPDTGSATATRTIRVKAFSQSITIQFPNCLWTSLHSDGPSGPLLLSSTCAAPLLTFVGPCNQLSHPFTLPTALPAGTYWLKCDYIDVFTAQPGTSWVDFRIDGANDATLSPTDQPELGFTWTIDLLHPSDPAATYLAAASLTTDVGFPVGTQVFSLDQDLLFGLSFPFPFPGLFTNFQGGLNAAGSASVLMHIPNIPALDCLGIHVQAVMLNSNGTLEFTNCVDDTLFST